MTRLNPFSRAKTRNLPRRAEPWRALLATGLLILGFAWPAWSHGLGAVQADITFRRNGSFLVDVQVDPEHLPASLNPFRGLPPVVTEQELQLRKMAFQSDFLAQLALSFDGVKATFKVEPLPSPGSADPAAAWRFAFRLTGPIPGGARSFTWSHPYAMGQYLLRLRQEGDAEARAIWVEGGHSSAPFELGSQNLPKTRLGRIFLYLGLGFTHILPNGTDHILFVLGLFFLSLRLNPLLWQVTSFTVAHSLTLALSLFGVLSLTPRIVEPLIAMSIVYVAMENLLTDRVHSWRVAVVFSFGLLHGLGFAAALHDLHIPRSDFLSALISFNAGVEFGQLAVLLLAFLAVAWTFGKQPWYRSRISIPASVLIGLVGIFWTIQRLFFG